MSTHPNSRVLTSTLSATAPVYEPSAALNAELALAQAHLASLQATARRDMHLALSEESSSNEIEVFLSIKRQDRLIAIRKACMEEQDRVIQEAEEWAVIEDILEIGREGFRTEMKMYDLQPIIQESEPWFQQIKEADMTLRSLGERYEVKLAEGIARRNRMARRLSPVVEEDETETR